MSIDSYFYNSTLFPSVDFTINMTLNFTGETYGTFAVLSQGNAGDQEKVFIEMDYSPGDVTMWLGPYTPAVAFEITSFPTETDIPFTFTYNHTTLLLSGYMNDTLIGTYTMPSGFINGNVGFWLNSSAEAQEIKVADFKLTESAPLVVSQSVDPLITLLISNDGGNTWGNPIQATLGRMGKWITRARFNRLGVSRNRVYRVVITEAVRVQLYMAMLDVEVGNA